MTNTPSWWHDADQLYTVLTDLLRHLRRRASTFDERTEACLYLSGLHLDHGPWRYVQEVDAVGEIGFETGLVLVNELLARLQELSWQPDARSTIGHAHDRIDCIFDPPELTWLRPTDRSLDDDE
ncbi:MAG: hypothetical protein V9G04_19245 [Nocardioides sp.]